MITLVFKSISPFFEKERDNLKCGTVREVSSEDDTIFGLLMQIIQTREYFRVKIINPDTEEEFMRKGSDVTYWDEKFIISWERHETFVGKVKACRASEFNGIECLETDDQYGFFRSDVDIRPSSCTWISPDAAEHLFELFVKHATGETERKK